MIGVTFATTTTPSAFPAKKVDPRKDKKQDPKGKDNGKANGNTDPDTIQKCKQFASGFDPTFGDQNCDILSNSTISQAAAVTPTGTLLVKKVCRDFAGTPCSFTITVTGNNPQPSTFVLQDGDSQLVTLGPGSYMVKEAQPSGFIASFAGDCTEIAINATATGVISAGQHQTCTITNFPER